MTTPASDWYIYPSCNLLPHIVRKKILLFSPGRPRRALQPAEMMCVQIKFCLLCLGWGNCGWGTGCIESGLPRQLNTFLFTQTILQQLRNQKMGIMQGQIMQVRSYSVRTTIHRICVSLFSPSFAEVKCPHLLVWFFCFTLRKHCLFITLSFATNSLLNKWAASIFVNLQLLWP